MKASMKVPFIGGLSMGINKNKNPSLLLVYLTLI